MMETICPYCNHNMENNRHGWDQNDFGLDANGEFQHTGTCTYCKVCNPRLAELENWRQS